MSATHSLNPAPPAPSGRGAPVEASSTGGKRSLVRVLILSALIAGGAFAAYQLLAQPAAENKAAAQAATARVTSGSIRRVLRLTGSTIAKNFRSVAAPLLQGPDAGRNLVLTYVAPSGARVKKGDVVAQIDAQALKDHVDDLNAEIEQSDANIRKRKAQQTVNWENLQQTLRVAKSNLEQAKLDASAAEIRTLIDAELVKLRVEEAEATYKEQTANLAGRQSSDAIDIRILELGRERIVRHRDRHKRDIEMFTIRAPIDGLVVMQMIRRGRELVQVQQGDEVAPAQPFLKVVDIGSMQVQATVSQVEAEEIRLGQPAKVSFDAFPDMTLNAKVINIGAIATPGLRVNYFLRSVPVFLAILDADDRIIPDLSTSNDIVVEETAKAPLIPRSAVESRDGKSFVRVKRGDVFETREVKLGRGDNIRVSVVEGVREGDEVALERPVVASEPAGN